MQNLRIAHSRQIQELSAKAAEEQKMREEAERRNKELEERIKQLEKGINYNDS